MFVSILPPIRLWFSFGGLSPHLLNVVSRPSSLQALHLRAGRTSGIDWLGGICTHYLCVKSALLIFMSFEPSVESPEQDSNLLRHALQACALTIGPSGV